MEQIYYRCGSLLRKRGLLLLFVVLLMGCYNRFDAAPTDLESEELEYNMTLDRLHELIATQDYIDIKDDVVVRGSVTANDVGGNFYRTFVIEQNGAGVEVLEGISYTYVRYPEGSVVAISLNGLRLAWSYGVLQIGVAAATGSYYDLDYMGHEVVVDKYVTNSGIIEMVEPLQVTLEQLYSDTSYESMCGRLVRVEGVRFMSEEYEADDRVWSGSRLFVDDEGRELGIYTSEYAYYSMVEIEQGYGSVTGILEYGTVDGSSVAMVKMRSAADHSVD